MHKRSQHSPTAQCATVRILVVEIVLCASGALTNAKWKDLRVGQIVKVMDDELFPADLLCLKTGLPDNLCYIRTTNLDGESNLKIRKPVDLRGMPGFNDEENDVRNKSLQTAESYCGYHTVTVL